jgi:hypothetical protein
LLHSPNPRRERPAKIITGAAIVKDDCNDSWKSVKISSSEELAMHLRHIAFFTFSLLLAAPQLYASEQKPDGKLDISGTWTWLMQRPNGGGREVTLTLKQDGEKLTGTVTGMGGETDIQEGTFKDGQLSFKIVRSRGGMDTITTYTGRFEGDVLKGKAETDQNGRKVPRDWEAHRAKEEKP